MTYSIWQSTFQHRFIIDALEFFFTSLTKINVEHQRILNSYFIISSFKSNKINPILIKNAIKCLVPQINYFQLQKSHVRWRIQRNLLVYLVGNTYSFLIIIKIWRVKVVTTHITSYITHNYLNISKLKKHYCIARYYFKFIDE